MTVRSFLDGSSMMDSGKHAFLLVDGFENSIRSQWQVHVSDRLFKPFQKHENDQARQDSSNLTYVKTPLLVVSDLDAEVESSDDDICAQVAGA